MTFFAWILLVCVAILFLPGTDPYHRKRELKDYNWDAPWVYLSITANICAIVLALKVVIP